MVIDNNDNYGLSEKDMRVFKTACEYAISLGSPFLYMADVWKKLRVKGFSETDIDKSLESLHLLGFINKSASYTNEKFYNLFFITSAGFEIYLRHNYPDFHKTFNEVAQYVKSTYLNGKKETLQSEHIANTCKQSKVLINYILEKLYSQGKIKLLQAERGNWMVHKVIE
jgi:hypothetical protein